MIKDFFKREQIEYKENISLKKYNTYQVDSTCSYLVFPKDEKELIKVIKELKKECIKYLILGNGSNVIFESSNYNGAIIKLDKLSSVKYNGNYVTVGAGYSLIRLAMETIEKGLSGLEFAAGIPGTVGASTAMNAGAYNSDMSNVVKSIKVLDNNLEIITMSNDNLQYEYRDSYIKKNSGYIVLSTTFELTEGDIIAMKELIKERRIKRNLSQPLNMPNAGSVFRNPENMHAGALIENCNLKGFAINDAEVSTKHANFIINKGNATGKDIITLINKIKEEVKNKYNVELKLEQIIIK